MSKPARIHAVTRACLPTAIEGLRKIQRHLERKFRNVGLDVTILPADSFEGDILVVLLAPSWEAEVYLIAGDSFRTHWRAINAALGKAIRESIEADETAMDDDNPFLYEPSPN